MKREMLEMGQKLPKSSMIKGKGQTATLIAAIAVTISIIGLIGAGWALRPIIDYKMSGITDDYGSMWGPMDVSLLIRNRGNIDAKLYLVVTVTNANVTVDKDESWIECNGTQAMFYIAAISHMEDYDTYSIKVSPVGNPQNFTISYTFDDATDGFPNGMISKIFLESHGYSPINAFYNRTDTNVYQRVKK